MSKARTPRTIAGTVARIATSAIAFGVVFGLTAAPASAETLDTSTEGVEVVGKTVTAADDTVSMSLPGRVTSDEVDLSLVPDGQFKGDGEPAVSTVLAGSTISTYATEEGAQTLIEIPSAASPGEYRFPLDIPAGGEAVLLDDGSVALFSESGDPLGGFHVPWAYDANGKEVPTSFRIEGDTLIQSVDLSKATAFPVIADPDRGTEWWGVWTRFTRAETKNIARDLQRNNAVMIKDLMTAACGFAPGWTAAACGVVVQAKWYLTFQPAIDAASQNKCFALNIPRFAPGISINGTVVNCTR